MLSEAHKLNFVYHFQFCASTLLEIVTILIEEQVIRKTGHH